MKHPIQPGQKVAIFGAGLVGSLLGIALARKGFRIEIHEKRPDLRYRRYSNLRSINLALSHRGWRALEAAGLGERLRQEALPMYGRVVHPADGGPEQFFPYGQADQAIYSISRHGLNCLLLDEAERQPGLRLYFESKAEKFSFDKSLAYVADVEGLRQRIEADAFFGSDGAFSALRYEMMREDQFDYQQDYIEHGYKEFTIPPRPDGDWALRPDGLHIWPRKSFMLIALPNRDKTFTATLFFPFRGAESFESLQRPEAVQAFFSREFPDFLTLVPDLLHQYTQHPTASLVTIRCAPWNQGNFLLIGDAAHAIVPFYGQGMNAGFEDCRLLLDVLEGADTWEGAFETFYQNRKADALAISELALENFVEMRDKVADPHFQLKKKLEAALLQTGLPEWIPLYTMVTFSDIPYALAQARGRRQDEILEILARLENWNELPPQSWPERLRTHFQILFPFGAELPGLPEGVLPGGPG